MDVDTVVLFYASAEHVYISAMGKIQIKAA